MAAWEATVEQPIACKYRGRYEVLKAGSPHKARTKASDDVAAAFARMLGVPVAAGAKERINDDRVQITAVIGDMIKTDDDRPALDGEAHVAHRRQAVRDDDAGAAAQGPAQRGEDAGLHPLQFGENARRGRCAPVRASRRPCAGSSA